MVAKVLSKPLRKLLTIGSIHNNFEKISHIAKLASDYDKILINGGALCPNDNLDTIKLKIDKINQLTDTIYIVGRNDLEFLNQEIDEEISVWIRNQCNIVIVKFLSHDVLIMDGGLPLSVKHINHLLENVEISFVSRINNYPWHKYYNGGLGYVISNNPISDKPPEYYNYSMQLGHQSLLYAQEFDEIGLKQTILI